VKNAIVQKLQDEFDIPIERESQVVYILVEVRKLFDSEPKEVKNKYVTLQFFCDWALHIKLRKRNAGLLLQPFDEAYGRRGPDGMMLTEDQKRLQEKISLIEFTRQLVEVLESYGIAMNSLIGPQAWFRFIELYLSIIKDCSLDYTDREIKLNHVNQVVVTLYEVPEEVRSMEPNMHMPFGIDWRFSFKGKPVFHWPMPFAARNTSLPPEIELASELQSQ
jgi:hypothetical protein